MISNNNSPQSAQQLPLSVVLVALHATLAMAVGGSASSESAIVQ
jgi:hypothetical protein